MIDTDKGSEWSLNRLDMHFASEECTVLDQIHEHHPEPGLAPVRNTIARGHVRWYSFTPRLYDWNFLLVETNVELLRDVELKKSHAWTGPPLCTLSYSPSEINSMDRFAYRAPDGMVSREAWGPLSGRPKNSPFQHRALDVGGYVGLYPGKTASLVVYSLDANAQVSLADSNLRLGFGRGGEKLRKGQRFSFHYLVGLKYLMSTPEDFEKIHRLYGLDNEAPGYSVDLDVGEVVSTQYALRFRADGYAVRGRITECPELPSDLPLILEGVNDRWTVSLYDYNPRYDQTRRIERGCRVLGAGHQYRPAQTCSLATPLSAMTNALSSPCIESRVKNPGSRRPRWWDYTIRHTKTSTSLSGVRSSAYKPVSGSRPGLSRVVRVSLADWTAKRITVHTNELTAQIPRHAR